MFLTRKEIFFFILAFVVIFMFSEGAIYIGPKMNIKITPVLIVMSLLCALLLLLIYKFGNISHCQADGFHFQVSEPKLCRGWPYMQSSAPPKLQNYCAKLLSTKKGRQKFENMNCTNPGFNGQPLMFKRTPMSNDLWENEMCKSDD